LKNILKNINIEQQYNIIAILFWVSYLTTFSIFLFSGITQVSLIMVVLNVGLGYLAADAFTGLYHFLLDNFEFKKITILREQAKSFQQHHKTPTDILDFSYSRLIAPASFPAGILVTIISLIFPPHLTIFVITFTLLTVHSQVFHKWSHRRKNNKIISFLQKRGYLLSRVHHLSHHKKPHHKRYAIISGTTNYIFDYLKVYTILGKLLKSPNYSKSTMPRFFFNKKNRKK